MEARAIKVRDRKLPSLEAGLGFLACASLGSLRLRPLERSNLALPVTSLRIPWSNN